jgi:hypothetical protein
VGHLQLLVAMVVQEAAAEQEILVRLELELLDKDLQGVLPLLQILKAPVVVVRVRLV